MKHGTSVVTYVGRHSTGDRANHRKKIHKEINSISKKSLILLTLLILSLPYLYVKYFLYLFSIFYTY
nr:MAG TPA: hypothetical protein [Bacteriophage sp.]